MAEGKIVVLDDLQIIPVELSNDKNPALVYLAGLAPTGRRAMATRLREVCKMLNYVDPPETFPWDKLRFQHVAAIRAYFVEADKSPATVNATLCALRGVAKAAFNLSLMSADDYQRLCFVKSVKGERLPAGRALTSGEIKTLFVACADDKSIAGVRDAALLAILYGAGLRRAEIVGLDMEDYKPETGELKVRGKGNKERLAYATNGSADALDAWLIIRGNDPGALFCPINKSGVIKIGRLTEQAIYNILQKWCAKAGVKPCSPHDLRRTFVSDLLDNGADIVSVQHLAGHANVQTTARYDRRGEKAKRKAAELLHVPFVAANLNAE